MLDVPLCEAEGGRAVLIFSRRKEETVGLSVGRSIHANAGTHA